MYVFEISGFASERKSPPDGPKDDISSLAAKFGPPDNPSRSVSLSQYERMTRRPCILTYLGQIG